MKKSKPPCPRCNGFMSLRRGDATEAGLVEEYVACVHCGFRIEKGMTKEDILKKIEAIQKVKNTVFRE